MISLETIQSTLRAAADPERARGQSAYMRHQFTFLGLSTPQRTQLSRPLLAQARSLTLAEVESLVRQLWALDEREFHYFALALSEKAHRVWTPPFLATLRHLVVTRSWWDTVDWLATRHVGKLLQRFPELIPTMDEWIASDNFWIQRTALLFQLSYKQKTDRERLFGYCRQVAGSSEFFLRKAIGWALRHYARTDPAGVRQFVDEMGQGLSPLSRREALKHLLPGA